MIETTSKRVERLASELWETLGKVPMMTQKDCCLSSFVCGYRQALNDIYVKVVESLPVTPQLPEDQL